MSIKHNLVLIGTFYKPSNSNISIINDIEASIDLAIDTGIKTIIITGDFNLDYLKPNTCKKIDDICNKYSMTQIIDEPTHFTEIPSSLIDIFIKQSREYYIKWCW